MKILLALVFASSAFAQSYPSKPIRLIVPYAAGGTSDILARQIGQKLTETWNQPVVVENKTGANGNVGADFVAKSAPDGYTLLLDRHGRPRDQRRASTRSCPSTPSKDFSPVIMVAYSPHVLAVHPSVKATQREGADRAGEGESRQAELRRLRHRRRAAARRHRVRAAHRRQVDLHPLQGRLGRGRRRGRRQAEVLFNGMLATWPSVKERQVERARHLQPEAPRRARTCRPSPNRACRLRDRSCQGIVGPAGIAEGYRRQAERRTRARAQHRRT